MTIEYDDKGKYFTNIITKTAIPAKIKTKTNLVEGEIHIKPDERLKDELDLPEPFLAVTNATVYTEDGQVAFQTDFLAIRREQIVWVTALSDVSKEKTS